MNAKINALLPLAVFIALIVAFAIGLTRDPRVIPSQLIDKPFPEFELGGLYEETPITRDDLLGDVSLVNVFGSWCVACLYEHPILMDLSRSGQVRVIGINWRDDRNKAKDWLKRHGDPYKLIIYDPYTDLILDLGVTGAPETFIVDQNGKIRYKHVGVITEELWRDTFRPIILKIRAET